MTGANDVAGARLSEALEKLGAEDRELFLAEKQRYLERGLADSPLLDELCCVRVVAQRLSEGYATALAEFDRTLEERTRMRVGWRKSITVKRPTEYESPMPWLHPFRLAGEELASFVEELEAAVLRGETEAKDPARIGQVLEGHGLGLPLPSPAVPPAFPPGGVRTYK